MAFIAQWRRAHVRAPALPHQRGYRGPQKGSTRLPRARPQMKRGVRTGRALEGAQGAS